MIISCSKCNIQVEVLNKRTKLCSTCKTTILRERSRNYKLKNVEKIRSYNQKYKQENKQQISEYNRAYNIDNRENIQKRQTETNKKRRHIDMNFKMSIVLRNRLRKFYTGQNKSIKNTIGCSLENLKKWIEHNFVEDMTWENHGKLWHIDHVLPCSLFNLLELEDRNVCFNWKNMRPLLATKNMSKKNKLDCRDIINHQIIIRHYKLKNQDYNDIDYNYFATKLLEKSNGGSS